MSKEKKNVSPITTESIMQLMPHMRPHIRISPFIPCKLEDLAKCNHACDKSIAQTPSYWLNDSSHIYFYDSGRSSIFACLKNLNVKGDDEVLIVKTTDGPYISSCVTKTIERLCKWSQKESDKTRVVLVIHEFGLPCPYDKVQKLKENGIPVIEDCAYALGSRIEGDAIGVYGDFAIYSLPKYYPLPFGGILVSKKNVKICDESQALPDQEKELLVNAINNAQPFLKEWNLTRRNNWKFFADNVTQNGLPPFFDLSENTVPGVFLCKTPEGFSGEEVKKRLNAAGVESTQYYNQGGFYFPVHQFLTEYEKSYILFHFLND